MSALPFLFLDPDGVTVLACDPHLLTTSQGKPERLRRRYVGGVCVFQDGRTLKIDDVQFLRLTGRSPMSRAFSWLNGPCMDISTSLIPVAMDFEQVKSEVVRRLWEEPDNVEGFFEHGADVGELRDRLCACTNHGEIFRVLEVRDGDCLDVMC